MTEFPVDIAVAFLLTTFSIPLSFPRNSSRALN